MSTRDQAMNEPLKKRLEMRREAERLEPKTDHEALEQRVLALEREVRYLARLVRAKP